MQTGGARFPCLVRFQPHDVFRDVSISSTSQYQRGQVSVKRLNSMFFTWNLRPGLGLRAFRPVLKSPFVSECRTCLIQNSNMSCHRAETITVAQGFRDQMTNEPCTMVKLLFDSLGFEYTLLYCIAVEASSQAIAHMVRPSTVGTSGENSKFELSPHRARHERGERSTAV